MMVVGQSIQFYGFLDVQRRGRGFINSVNSSPLAIVSRFLHTQKTHLKQKVPQNIRVHLGHVPHMEWMQQATAPRTIRCTSRQRMFMRLIMLVLILVASPIVPDLARFHVHVIAETATRVPDNRHPVYHFPQSWRQPSKRVEKWTGNESSGFWRKANTAWRPGHNSLTDIVEKRAHTNTKKKRGEGKSRRRKFRLTRVYRKIEDSLGICIYEGGRVCVCANVWYSVKAKMPWSYLQRWLIITKIYNVAAAHGLFRAASLAIVRPFDAKQLLRLRLIDTIHND